VVECRLEPAGAGAAASVRKLGMGFLVQDLQ